MRPTDAQVIEQLTQVLGLFGRGVALLRHARATMTAQVVHGHPIVACQRMADLQVPERQVGGEAVDQHHILDRKREGAGMHLRHVADLPRPRAIR